MSSRFVIQAVPLPPDFNGNLQQLFEAMLDRMEIVSDGALFIEASSLPAGNVGPLVLLNGSQLWTWSEVESEYVPLDISESETSELVISNTAPTDGVPRVWFKTTGTNGTVFDSIHVYMGSTLGYVQMAGLSAGSVTNAMLAGSITADKLAAGVIPTLATITGLLPFAKLTLGTAHQILRMNAGATEWVAGPLIEASAEQAISAGSDEVITVAHGLGAAPGYRDAVLVCKTVDADYAADDEVSALSCLVSASDNSEKSALQADATSLRLIRRRAFTPPRKDGTNVFTLDVSKWKLKFYYAR